MAKCTDVLYVKSGTDEFYLTGRSCELSAFSFIPKEHNEPKERVVYNSEKKDRYSHSTYDRLFHQDFGYNNKLHRCDREHAKANGLAVNDEEVTKEVPSLASSVYGQKVPKKGVSDLDAPDRKHVRIARVQAEFFRRNEIINPQDTH